MRIKLLVLFIVSVSRLYAFDKPTVDSLQNQLRTSKDTSKSEVLYQLGKEYLFHQEDTAYQYVSQLIQHATQIKDSTGLARGYNLIGIFYYVRHIYHKAFENFTKAAKLFDATNDQVGLAKCYNNMGIILKKERDFKKGIEYYRKSLVINQSENNIEGVIGTLDNIGIVYKELGQLDSAQYYYSRALEIATEQGLDKQLSNLYNNIGALYKHKEEYDKALDYVLKSIRIKEDLGYNKKVIQSYTTLADIYRLYGLPDSAIKYGLLASAYDDVGIQRNASEVLARTYEQNGQFENSVNHYSKFIHLKDSIFDAEEVSDIQKQEKVFAIEEKEKARLEKEKQERLALERKQNLQYTIIIIIIITAFVLFFAFGLMKVKPMIVNPMIVVLLLITFEFILVFTEPYVDAWADNSPLLKLSANMCLAVMLLPLHGLLEKVLKKGKGEIKKS